MSNAANITNKLLTLNCVGPVYTVCSLSSYPVCPAIIGLRGSSGEVDNT